MAFAVASKGATLAGLLKNLLHAARSSSALGPASSVATTRRLFSTAGGAPFSREEDCYEETIGDKEFVFYHRLHQGNHPMFSTTASRWWVSKQDENVLQVKMEMPGLAAEHVKVWTYPKGLLIKGEGDAADQAPDATLYTARIGVSADAFKADQAQAEMKNGILTVTVPKVKVDLGESTEIKVRKAE